MSGPLSFSHRASNTRSRRYAANFRSCSYCSIIPGIFSNCAIFLPALLMPGYYHCPSFFSGIFDLKRYIWSAKIVAANYLTVGVALTNVPEKKSAQGMPPMGGEDY